ncbi:MAG TPA: methionyl-tRNA formyltransferase [Armatimonadota bacterium]|nr:methionyl-tRNA formyltransferase [Armatimonadota bacterium]
MRVVFFGTPEVAVPYLDAMVAAGHEIAAAVTQPDRPAGRGRRPQPSPVKQAAIERDIEVLEPESAAEESFVQRIRELAPQVGVVVAYGQILRSALLAVPSVAFVNVHYSLLPLLRGAAPVHGALRRGMTRTGVTVQHLAAKMDAGDIIIQRELPINDDDDRGTLTDRLTEIGTGALVEALALLAAGQAPRIPQDHAQATVQGRVSSEDCRVDWSAPAEEMRDLVRACTPWPGAWAMLGERRVKLVKIAGIQKILSEGGRPGEVVELREEEGPVVRSAAGSVVILRLQPPGKRVMSGAEFLRGARLAVGDRFD